MSQNELNWHFRCINILGSVKHHQNRESEPNLESEYVDGYDEYQSVELDTANKANKGLAWQVPGIMRSLDIHYHQKTNNQIKCREQGRQGSDEKQG